MDTARLNEIVRGRRGIKPDTALRLARYLGTSAELWLGLQLEYDLRLARTDRLKTIEHQVKPKVALEEPFRFLQTNATN